MKRIQTSALFLVRRGHYHREHIGRSRGLMVDVLLETAISNWEPRFTANGVDASDYARITRSLEHWNEWCAAWCSGAEAHLALGDVALEEGRRRSAGEFYAAPRPIFILRSFSSFTISIRRRPHTRARSRRLTRRHPSLCHRQRDTRFPSTDHTSWASSVSPWTEAHTPQCC